jgi:hypothetical protein
MAPSVARRAIDRCTCRHALSDHLKTGRHWRARAAAMRDEGGSEDGRCALCTCAAFVPHPQPVSSPPATLDDLQERAQALVEVLELESPALRALVIIASPEGRFASCTNMRDVHAASVARTFAAAMERPL